LYDIQKAISILNMNKENLTYEEFEVDETHTPAILYELVIIGEAAGNIPQSILTRYFVIPWRKIVDLRNILVHAYGTVNRRIVWDIVINEIAPLQETIAQMLTDLEKEAP